MKIVIVGGVAGGATAAARLRRLDEKAQIIMIDKGDYISYANCGLPYYLGGVIKNRERLFLQTPQSFYSRYRIDVRIASEVTKIDCKNKQVEVKNLANGEVYSESYDKLILSTGVEPIKPDIEGVDNEGIFMLRNVADTDAIKRYISNHNIQRAVVVGAGFIGMEMVENLTHLGIEVSIVEAKKQLLPILDFSMSALVQDYLTRKNIKFYLGNTVTKIFRQGEDLCLALNNGEQCSCQMIIFSIGVKADTKIESDAGLQLDAKGSVVVDKYLRTSDKDIYAVGDMIVFNHPVTQKPKPVFLAGPANKQGRIVADNIVFDNISHYEGSVGTSIMKLFDMTIATTGLTVSELKDNGFNYKSSITHSPSHATYYPDASQMSIKLNFDAQSGQLYGAQIVGFDGVDKRIDIFSLTIAHRGAVQDLCAFEQAYAPPFSSAKDPVNIAATTAENLLHGLLDNITWHEVIDHQDAYQLLDVRTNDEYAKGSIAGALHIPVDELRNRLDELPKNKQLVVFCAVGMRAYLATRILLQNGFSALNLSGGYKTYSAVAKM